MHRVARLDVSQVARRIQYIMVNSVKHISTLISMDSDFYSCNTTNIINHTTASKNIPNPAPKEYIHH